MAADVVVAGLGPLLTLQGVKQYLRVDHDDDDDVLTGCMDAAVGQVLAYCKLVIAPPGREAEFRAAALIAAQALYDVREGSVGLPLASVRLIEPYRSLRV